MVPCHLRSNRMKELQDGAPGVSSDQLVPCLVVCTCASAFLPAGLKLVSVDGELTEIFFQEMCQAWFFEVGDTLYWLSGLDDLVSRELEVVDMVADDSDCGDRIGASDTANCYRCVSVSMPSLSGSRAIYLLTSAGQPTFRDTDVSYVGVRRVNAPHRQRSYRCLPRRFESEPAGGTPV